MLKKVINAKQTYLMKKQKLIKMTKAFNKITKTYTIKMKTKK